MKNEFYILFLFAFCFASCVEPADFIVPDGDSKIVGYCEFSQHNQVKVKVSSAIGTNTQDEILHPEDAQLEMYYKGEALNAAFRYFPDEDVYLSGGISSLDINKEYELRIEIPETDLPPAKAFSIIPEPKELEKVNLESNNSYLDDFGLYQFEAEVEVKLPPSSSYYILKIQRRIVEKPNQQSQIYLNSYVDLTVDNILTNSSGIQHLPYMNAILVNPSKISNQSFKLALSSTDGVDLEKFAFDHLYFELKTINEDAYEYHRTVSKQIEAEESPLSEPVISYTNFENGLGLFSGYSTSLDSLSL